MIATLEAQETRGEGDKRGPRRGKKDFKNDLSKRLECWMKGEETRGKSVEGIDEKIFNHSSELIEFPCNLTPAERRMVHQICLRLDLFHASFGEGDQRRVTISKSFDALESYIDQQQESSNLQQQESSVPQQEFMDDDVSRRRDTTTISPSIWYDIRVIKPTMKARYFEFSEKEMLKLHEKVGSIDSIDTKVRIAMDPMSLQAELDSTSRLQMFLGSSEPLPDSFAGENIVIQATLVDAPDLLRAAGTRLRGCHAISFDLEMHSFRSYHGLTCLIQLSGGTGYNYIIDPLAPHMWKLIPEVLGPIFTDPRIVKIGHGIVGGDVPALFRDFGIVIVNAFDTQEASVCLGMGGLGLASLLDRWGCPSKREIASLKVHMKHTDWRLRPMTPTMLRYAILDVHYLIPLYRLQVRELLLASANAGWKEALGLISKEDKETAKRLVKTQQKEDKKPNPPRNGSSTKDDDDDAAPSASSSSAAAAAASAPALPSASVVAVHLNGQQAEDDEEDGLEVWGGGGGAGDEGEEEEEGDDGGGGAEESGADCNGCNAAVLDDDDCLADCEDEDDDDLWDGWGAASDNTTGAAPEQAEKAATPSSASDKREITVLSAEGEWDIARSHLSRSNSCASSGSGCDRLPLAHTGRDTTDGADRQQRKRTKSPVAAPSLIDQRAIKLTPTSMVTDRSGSFDTAHHLACLVTVSKGGADDPRGDAQSAQHRQILAAILRDYHSADHDAALFHASAIHSDPRLSVLGAALSVSQRSCAKLWAPKKMSEIMYTKVSGFSQRNRSSSSRGSGGARWGSKNVYIFRELFFWREREALERDESPAFICPSSLLLDVAEYLPSSLAALSKLHSPLPPLMRISADPSAEGSCAPLDILAALRSASERWEEDVKNDPERIQNLPGCASSASTNHGSSRSSTNNKRRERKATNFEKTVPSNCGDTEKKEDSRPYSRNLALNGWTGTVVWVGSLAVVGLCVWIHSRGNRR